MAMSTAFDQIESMAGAARDFRAAGLQHSATSVRTARNPRIGFDETREVPVVAGSRILGLVPTSPASRSFMRDHGFYGRVTSLTQRVGLDAEFLGFVEDGYVPSVYPIVERFLVGSLAAIAANPVQLEWISSDDPLLDYVSAPGHFREPSALFRVDRANPVEVSLPTGYAPGPSGQTTGLPRVLHHNIDVLRDLANSGGVLKGTAQA